MKPSKKMAKWMLRALLAVGAINVIGIIVGLYIGHALLTIVFVFNAVVLGLAYNRVAMEEADLIE